jgi:hypothetical protein
MFLSAGISQKRKTPDATEVTLAVSFQRAGERFLARLPVGELTDLRALSTEVQRHDADEPPGALKVRRIPLRQS